MNENTNPAYPTHAKKTPPPVRAMPFFFYILHYIQFKSHIQYKKVTPSHKYNDFYFKTLTNLNLDLQLQELKE